MVGLSALWMPIVVSAVFVLIALLLIAWDAGMGTRATWRRPRRGEGHG